MAHLFKEGDKVYYPRLSTEILTVKSLNLPVSDSTKCTLLVEIGEEGDDDYDLDSFTADGKVHNYEKVPALFPATEESRTKLKMLYGVDFEQPT